MELEDTVLPGSEIISLLVRRQFNMERCYHPVFLYCFGVPKGSLLRSFVTYINDLPQCLLHSAISMYADGSVIHYTGSNINIIRENLQEDLKRVKQWLMSSRLILNQSQTKGNYCKPHQTLCCRSKVQLSWGYARWTASGESIPTPFVTKSISVWDF